ncbi:MAG: hypothetical protein ACOZAN_01500 [Patescibacteria group bacterium]
MKNQMQKRNQHFLNKIKNSFAIAAVLFVSLSGLAQAQSVFGDIEAPPGVEVYNSRAGGIGIIPFISTLIRIATIAAGIWVLFNFIAAGWMYISGAGDSNTSSKISNKLTMSVVGLVLIVTAYTITGIISYIVFGSASYILSPTFEEI